MRQKVKTRLVLRKGNAQRKSGKVEPKEGQVQEKQKHLWRIAIEKEEGQEDAKLFWSSALGRQLQR